MLEKLHTQLPHLRFERSDARIDDFLSNSASIASEAESLLNTVEPLGIRSAASRSELLSLAAEGRRVRQLRSGLNSDEQMSRLLGPIYRGIETDRGRLLATFEFVGRARDAALPAEVIRWLLCEEYGERFRWISEWLRDLESNTQLGVCGT